MEPTISEILSIGFGVVPIATKQCRAANRQFSGLSFGYLLILRINQFDLAERALLFVQAGRNVTNPNIACGCRGKAGFGGAKCVQIRRLKKRCDFGNLIQRHQIRHNANPFYRFYPGLFGPHRRKKRRNHSGHQSQPPQAFGGDQICKLIRLKPVHHDNGSPKYQGFKHRIR